jgi:alkaline phosphatase
MIRIALLIASLLIPLTLAACGGGSNDALNAEKIKEAIAFVAETDGSPGIFVEGRNIVLNHAQRPPTFAEHARRAALEATKAINGRQVVLYVIDSAETATAVPAQGQFYCSITANDGRMAGNNC